ncbi:hypothetical protein SAMN05421823_101174 [Catalinimonas alkaloidigena]|uniref:DUF2029 domain-containing protein n=1 Tax=Catalinimonas alkaloidigena TaxID=1075417 RepID=A0A1G8WTD6_9BACT|nr:hypothetical protein [Catalinimonas alkaloidigena]SDJ81307.1 hypothetical protein SAMN05421823_101174 [Catalinimonas alkaloidigena]
MLQLNIGPLGFRRHQAVMLGLFIVELGFYTVYANRLGPYLSASLFFVSSLGIGLYPLWCARQAPYSPDRLQFRQVTVPRLLVGQVLFGLGAVVLAVKQLAIIRAFPLDYHLSDVIPSVDQFVTRFLQGEKVYGRDIAYPEYSIIPNYLPFQWLPMTFSKWAQIDLRWSALLMCVTGIVAYEWAVLKANVRWGPLLGWLALPLVALGLMMQHRPDVFGYTVEPMVMGYYLLLGCSLMSRSIGFRAVALLLCGLSRFSLLLWVPLYLLILFCEEPRARTWRLLAYCVVGVLLVYIIPFMSQNWTAPFRAMQAYETAALGEWAGQAWQEPGAKPFQLFQGYGFAAFFHDFGGGALLDRLHSLQRTHLWLSLAAVVAMGVLFFRYRRRIDSRYFALISLKVYFAFFYNFIQVPYGYLFIVPVMLSVVVIFFLPFARSASTEVPLDQPEIHG